MVNELKKIDNITIYNANTPSGIVLFNINNIFSEDTSHFLNHYHICVRAGNHCAKMLKDEMDVKNTVRVSMYFYNTKEDVDHLVDALRNSKDIYNIVL